MNGCCFVLLLLEGAVCKAMGIKKEAFRLLVVLNFWVNHADRKMVLGFMWPVNTPAQGYHEKTHCKGGFFRSANFA